MDERSQGETALNWVEPKALPLAGNRERIIDICYELLCAGRPISDVLEEVKRLSHDPTRNAAAAGSPTPIELHRSVSHSSAVSLEPMSEPQAGPDSSVLLTRPGLVQRLIGLGKPLVALGVILLSLVTIVGSVQLGTARQKVDYQTEDQILRQLRERGQLISKSLLPALDNAELKDIRQPVVALKTLASGAQQIQLLFAPGGGESFYYAASWPSTGDFETQRRRLVGLGILDRLPSSCHAGAAFELLGSAPTGGEVAIAVNPLWTPAGCWVVVSSFAISESARGALKAARL